MITENNNYSITDLGYECIERNVMFANLNKNCNLETYKDEISKGDYTTKDVIVKRVVYADSNNWTYLTNSFLEDNTVWNEIGGHNLCEADDVEFKKTFPDDDDDKKIKFFNISQGAKEYFWAKGMALVTKLINKDNGNVVYINTEGYKYARYVGLRK